MEIKERGTYKAVADIITRGSRSAGTIPAGSVFEVTQIDKEYKKIIGPDFFDWIYWDLPAEKVDLR